MPTPGSGATPLQTASINFGEAESHCLTTVIFVRSSKLMAKMSIHLSWSLSFDSPSIPANLPKAAANASWDKPNVPKIKILKITGTAQMPFNTNIIQGELLIDDLVNWKCYRFRFKSWLCKSRWFIILYRITKNYSFEISSNMVFANLLPVRFFVFTIFTKCGHNSSSLKQSFNRL